MKKYYLLPFVAYLLPFHFACNQLLEDASLSDQLTLDQVFQSGSDLEAALVGAYDGVQHGGLLGRNTVLFADLLSQNVDYRAGAFEEIAFVQLPATSGIVENMWGQFYKTVNQLNAILAAIEPVRRQDATFTAEQVDQVTGEALCLRGILYFEMARLFCQPLGSTLSRDLGLPLMLQPILRLEQFQLPARSGIAQIYEQIEKDLTTATQLLLEEVRPYRVHRQVALGYLARMAFQGADYERTLGFTAEVIHSQIFELTNQPMDFFLQEGSVEEIWSIHNDLDDAIEGFGLSSVYHESSPNQAFIGADLKVEGFAKIITSEQSTRIEDAGLQVVDLRSDEGILTDHPLMMGGGIFSNKYENPWLQTKDDTPILRLAEILLMRAEALARIEGVNQESIDLLNQIRARSLRLIDSEGKLVTSREELFLFSPADFESPSQLIEGIILERRVELAFEGNRFHDLTRLKRDIKGYSFDAPVLRLPIPQRELDINPNLIQNPGY